MTVWWHDRPGAAARHPRLQDDIEVDVAVVGAGIVGLTTAELLRRGGRRVAVLEARRVGGQATGRSTGKVTSQHGLVYRRLSDDLGREGARLYGEANEAGLDRVVTLTRELVLDAGLERLPAYVYSAARDRTDELAAEAEAARAAGLPASLTRDTGLPGATAAVRFENQAQIHPARYLASLAAAVAAAGATVCEETRVTSIEHGEPCRVRTDHGPVVTARRVVVATQMPVVPEGMLFARAYPFCHPMVAAPVDRERVPVGMFISIDEPAHSFRLDRSSGAPVLLAVGGSYEGGRRDRELEMLEELERFLHAGFGIGRVSHRWTGEDFRPMDGVPFVGPASGGAENLLVATGFAGWGLSNGSAAAIMLADRILGRPNPWSELFDTARVRPLAGGPAFLRGNARVARHLAVDRLLRAERPFGGLAPGEGGVFDIDGEVVALSRAPDGTLCARSAVCTHLGCHVGWNPVDRTWDCPCHGSRFEADGTVLAGPATAPLAARPEAQKAVQAIAAA